MGLGSLIAPLVVLRMTEEVGQAQAQVPEILLLSNPRGDQGPQRFLPQRSQIGMKTLNYMGSGGLVGPQKRKCQVVKTAMIPHRKRGKSHPLTLALKVSLSGLMMNHLDRLGKP